VPDQGPDLWGGLAPCRSAGQVGPRDGEPGEVLVGEVDPAPAEVLGDVANEVRQLEGQAELAGRFPRRR
jgi:hypothetical protein